MGRVLIAGCGYLGTALGRLLHERGDEVWALRRRVDGLPGELRTITADLARGAGLDRLPGGWDAVYYTAAADRSDEAAYRAAYVVGLERLLAALTSQDGAPRRLLYCSSTSVYGQDRGEWVDERSPTEPRDFRGRVLLAGEQVARASSGETVILRLGGLYGPGRTRLIEAVRTGSARPAPAGTDPVYTNRIHRDDAARALAHLASSRRPTGIYLGVDEEPAARDDVLAWLAARVAGSASNGRATKSAPPAPRGQGKRCSSVRLRGTGFSFQYPTFREGYGSLIATGAAPSEPPGS